ncbi:MAG: restriction endonuclease [Leptospiraceae bacterium]|nr:restriction endonuclease [Leptospiraceae bacterium]
MAKPKPDYIIQKISNEYNSLEFKPLREVINNILSSLMEKEPIELVSEYTDDIYDNVLNGLQEIFAQLLDSGTKPRYEISGEGKDYYFKTFDQPELSLLRKLTLMDPKKFENFCAEILNKLGASETKSNGSKSDGGVDFIGYSISLSTSTIPYPKCSRVTVIGQSKRYKDGNTVTETELRKFIGGAVKETYILKKSIGHIRALTPIVYAFWTTSDFHSEAIKYAEEAGVWYLNGASLSQLAYSLGIQDVVL